MSVHFLARHFHFRMTKGKEDLHQLERTQDALSVLTRERERAREEEEEEMAPPAVDAKQRRTRATTAARRAATGGGDAKTTQQKQGPADDAPRQPVSKRIAPPHGVAPNEGAAEEKASEPDGEHEEPQGDSEEEEPKRDARNRKRGADVQQESKTEHEGLAGTTRIVEHARRSVGSHSESKQQEALASNVLTGSYLAHAGNNASELSRRLKQTWVILQKVANQHQEDEDVPLEQLRLVSAELLHEKILASDDKIVRSLAACCFTELFRIYAPDMPFKSNEELYDAFQLILEQIRLLAIETSVDPEAAKTSCDVHYFHILESLATGKSCLMLIGMDFTIEDGEETLLVQLFKALFETIRKEHSAKIENLMVAIMAACVEESDMIEQPLLDAILAPLVHSNSSAALGVQESTSSDSVERGPYHMAQELLRRTSDHIQSQLSHFFNSILVDAPTALTAHKPSELKEHVYTLIYAVHKINPSLLLYVLPNVCLQLQVDEVATRSEAIALMGRLFASSHADYGHQYMKNFRDFLGRFRDVSKEIRLQMVQVCAIIWQRKAELGGLIEKEFILRLSDPDWEVRRLVVNELCDLAASSLDLISEDCLRQVGERMKDKRVILRKETMTGLSQVYATHVSACWSPSDGEEDSLTSYGVPSTHAKKLGWVPDFVLKCFAYPQQDLKLRVVQLLDDILLPKAASETTRAKGLLYVFHSLDQVSKEALRRIFSERARCVQACREFVAAKKRHRQTSRGSIGLNSMALDEATEKLFVGISTLFPETPTLRTLLEQMSVWKDQSVFKHLEHLCDYSKSLEDIRAARDGLIKSVGSKTPLGEFQKILCRKLNLLTLNHSSISTYMDFFIQNGVQYVKENRDIVDLMVMVSKTFPDIFSPFVNDEFEAILLTVDEDELEKEEEDDENGEENAEAKDQRVLEGMLGVLANYSEHWKQQQNQANDDLEKDDDSETPSKLLLKQLERYCWNPSSETDSKQSPLVSAMEVHVSKLAALSIANFCGMSSDTSLLIQKLCAKKQLSSPTSPRVMSTLQSLLVFTKRCGNELAANKPLTLTLWSTLAEHFLNEDVIASETLVKKRKHPVTQAKLVEIRSLAIKVMVNLIMYCHFGHESAEFKERGQQLVALLFDVLSSDGRTWTANAGFAAKYRVVAASSLLKLMRNPRIERLVTVSEWHVLGFVMQDSSEEVRAAFIQKLTSHLMKHSAPHPHKYLSYLALAASEPSMVLKKKARTLLGMAIERMRRMFEASISRGRSEGVTAETTALIVPEYSLPYVIHLLAHHPDFPKEAAQRSVSLHASIFHSPVWSDQLLHLSFFLDGLVSSNNSSDADNISFLLQMLAKLSECDDVVDPSSTNIYPLVDSAALLVKKKIKKQSSLKPFPGRIYLPKQLFAAGSGGKGATPSRPTSTDTFGNTLGSNGPRMMVRFC